MADPFLQHEVVDRLHVTQDIIEHTLLNHPFVLHNEDVRALIEEAQSKLGQAYQLAAQK